jgi:hypothetical protein
LVEKNIVRLNCCHKAKDKAEEGRKREEKKMRMGRTRKTFQV